MFLVQAASGPGIDSFEGLSGLILLKMPGRASAF
jgi:hypothetical protein